jgi:hypothetical protein
MYSIPPKISAMNSAINDPSLQAGVLVAKRHFGWVLMIVCGSSSNCFFLCFQQQLLEQPPWRVHRFAFFFKLSQRLSFALIRPGCFFFFFFVAAEVEIMLPVF